MSPVSLIDCQEAPSVSEQEWQRRKDFLLKDFISQSRRGFAETQKRANHLGPLKQGTSHGKEELYNINRMVNPSSWALAPQGFST